MRNVFIILSLFLCVLQQLQAQEDGVVSYRLPVRNSLKFNRYLINPAFSFVREQSSYISFYTKKQWVQFDDAPQTYLFGYSGRIAENQGAAIGLFQQNYGVLSTFGGVVNFAHNVMLQEDNNLTFGLNLGFYKSGINKGRVITNYDDPNAEKIPNLVSPNNDGFNDTWIIPQEYTSGTDTEIVLMNATGEIVLKTNNYQNNWPETSTNFKNVNPVYYYIITTKDQKTKKGSITLVK